MVDNQQSNFAVNVVLGVTDKASDVIDGVLKKATTKETPIFASNDKIITQTQQILEQSRALHNLRAVYGASSPEVRKFTENMVTSANAVGITTSQLKRAEASTRAFSFAFLSLIFGGMALQRIFGGVFKDIIGTYRDAAGKSDEFNKSIGKASAAFDFLKFSMGSAFANSPIFTNLLNKVTDGLNALSLWSQKNPTLTADIVGLAGGLFLLGSAIFLLGTFKQLFMAGGTLDSLGKVGKISVGIVVSAFLVYDALSIFQDETTAWYDRLKSTIEWTVTGAIVGNIFGPGGATIGGMIGFSIGYLLNVIDVMEEDNVFTDAAAKLLAIAERIQEVFKSIWAGSYFETGEDGSTTWWLPLNFRILVDIFKVEQPKLFEDSFLPKEEDLQTVQDIFDLFDTTGEITEPLSTMNSSLGNMSTNIGKISTDGIIPLNTSLSTNYDLTNDMSTLVRDTLLPQLQNETTKTLAAATAYTKKAMAMERANRAANGATSGITEDTSSMYSVYEEH